MIRIAGDVSKMAVKKEQKAILRNVTKLKRNAFHCDYELAAYYLSGLEAWLHKRIASTAKKAGAKK